MIDKKISQAVIKRLPRYVRYLTEMRNAGVERVSSQEMSRQMKVTAAQIRQDLNNFGGFGQQGYGYNVNNLIAEINKILGLDEIHDIIIIGAGNLGRALAGYANFESRGLFIRALFDTNPTVDNVRGLPVMCMDELPSYLKAHPADIAVLTIPKDAALETARLLYENGVRAFWNFAHVDLNLPEDAYSENVHLSDSLMQLTYQLKHNGEKMKK